MVQRTVSFLHFEIQSLQIYVLNNTHIRVLGFTQQGWLVGEDGWCKGQFRFCILKYNLYKYTY